MGKHSGTLILSTTPLTYKLMIASFPSDVAANSKLSLKGIISTIYYWGYTSHMS